MEYLEDAFPQSTPLLPQDPVDRARVRLWIDHISRKIVSSFFRLFQAIGKTGLIFRQLAPVQIQVNETGSIGCQYRFLLCPSQYYINSEFEIKKL